MDNNILQYLDKLCTEGYVLLGENSSNLNHTETEKYKGKLAGWKNNVELVTKNILGPSEGVYFLRYTDDSRIIYEGSPAKIQFYVTQLETLKYRVENNLLGAFKSKAFDLVFEATIDQAREWLEEDQKEVAAILARIVIESKLRQIVSDKGITFKKIKPTAGDFNINLRDNGVYNEKFWKEIQAHIDLANDPKHQGTFNVDKNQVKITLDWIEQVFIPKFERT